MKKLILSSVEANDRLINSAEAEHSSLASPALSLLTDFKHSQPAIIDAQAPVTEVLQMMRYDRSRLKLVVDSAGELCGLIDQTQLCGEAAIRRVAAGENRAELRVADLMHPRERMKAMTYQQLQQCSVADVVNTLQSSGEAHCLVIDKDSHQIRGVISALDVARRLHMPVNVHAPATLMHTLPGMTG